MSKKQKTERGGQAAGDNPPPAVVYSDPATESLNSLAESADLARNLAANAMLAVEAGWSHLDSTLRVPPPCPPHMPPAWIDLPGGGASIEVDVIQTRSLELVIRVWRIEFRGWPTGLRGPGQA